MIDDFPKTINILKIFVGFPEILPSLEFLKVGAGMKELSESESFLISQ